MINNLLLIRLAILKSGNSLGAERDPEKYSAFILRDNKVQELIKNLSDKFNKEIINSNETKFHFIKLYSFPNRYHLKNSGLNSVFLLHYFYDATSYKFFGSEYKEGLLGKEEERPSNLKEIVHRKINRGYGGPGIHSLFIQINFARFKETLENKLFQIISGLNAVVGQNLEKNIYYRIHSLNKTFGLSSNVNKTIEALYKDLEPNSSFNFQLGKKEIYLKINDVLHLSIILSRLFQNNCQFLKDEYGQEETYDYSAKNRKTGDFSFKNPILLKVLEATKEILALEEGKEKNKKNSSASDSGNTEEKKVTISTLGTQKVNYFIRLLKNFADFGKGYIVRLFQTNFVKGNHLHNHFLPLQKTQQLEGYIGALINHPAFLRLHFSFKQEVLKEAHKEILAKYLEAEEKSKKIDADLQAINLSNSFKTFFDYQVQLNASRYKKPQVLFPGFKKDFDVWLKSINQDSFSILRGFPEENPGTNVTVLCNKIAGNLAAKKSFKNSYRNVLDPIMQSFYRKSPIEIDHHVSHKNELGTYGLKLQCRGRIRGASIAKKEKLFLGIIPQNNLLVPIHYIERALPNKSGICSTKLWLCLGRTPNNIQARITKIDYLNIIDEKTLERIQDIDIR